MAFPKSSLSSSFLSAATQAEMVSPYYKKTRLCAMYEYITEAGNNKIGRNENKPVQNRQRNPYRKKRHRPKKFQKRLPSFATIPFLL